MGSKTFTNDTYQRVRSSATSGGKKSATSGAEERIHSGKGMDPLVDPKGLPQFGPVRLSLPRFEPRGKLWRMTRGVPMPIETLADTTGSMGHNVDLLFEALPKLYDMLSSGKKAVLGRYDVQIANAVFNDVEDLHRIPDLPVLTRSQFEMDEKIAMQLTMLVPGRNGCGNGKEDSQFGLFAAAYLTAPSITRYGLKYYHFTISDEPTVETIDKRWLGKIFGDDVMDRVRQNGHEIKEVPTTAQSVKTLQKNAHAFFLQVADRSDVRDQWKGLYGPSHFVALPFGTEHLHAIQACIIGLTEGVFDLSSAQKYLESYKVPAEEAKRIIRAVSHIPLGAQAKFPNFDRLPKAGDIFKEKTDLWPVKANEEDSEEEETDPVSWA